MKINLNIKYDIHVYLNKYIKNIHKNETQKHLFHFIK